MFVPEDSGRVHTAATKLPRETVRQPTLEARRISSKTEGSSVELGAREHDSSAWECRIEFVLPSTLPEFLLPRQCHASIYVSEFVRVGGVLA